MKSKILGNLWSPLQCGRPGWTAQKQTRSPPTRAPCMSRSWLCYLKSIDEEQDSGNSLEPSALRMTWLNWYKAVYLVASLLLHNSRTCSQLKAGLGPAESSGRITRSVARHGEKLVTPKHESLLWRLLSGVIIPNCSWRTLATPCSPPNEGLFCQF